MSGRFTRDPAQVYVGHALEFCFAFACLLVHAVRLSSVLLNACGWPGFACAHAQQPGPWQQQPVRAPVRAVVLFALRSQPLWFRVNATGTMC